MKKIILSAFALFVFGFAGAQKKFEAKINPIGALFGTPDISGEYIVNDNFGVELGVSFAFGKTTAISVNGSEKPTQSGLGFKLAGKYYFNPDEGCDGWYGGLYFRQESLSYSYPSGFSSADYKANIVAAGIDIGKKWLFDSGVLIEIGFGVGRPLSESRTFGDSNNPNSKLDIELGIDFTGKLALGYRF